LAWPPCDASSHHDFGYLQVFFQRTAETGADDGICSKTRGCIHRGGGSIPTRSIGGQQYVVAPEPGGPCPIHRQPFMPGLMHARQDAGEFHRIGCHQQELHHAAVDWAVR
jgi:hypothetical protein